MRYDFICDECGKVREVECSVEDRNQAQFCLHTASENFLHIIKMRRLLSVPIINCNLEKDKPENQLGRVLAGGSSSQRDQLEALRKSDESYQRNTQDYPESEPKLTTVDDILATGLHPSMTKEAVQNWRKVHIPADDLASS